MQENTGKVAAPIRATKEEKEAKEIKARPNESVVVVFTSDRFHGKENAEDSVHPALAAKLIALGRATLKEGQDDARVKEFAATLPNMDKAAKNSKKGVTV